MPKKTQVIPSANAQTLTDQGTLAPELYNYIKSLDVMVNSLQSRLTMQSSAIDPTSANIADTDCQLWKNTTSGQVRLWANDGGVLKSVQLT
jgi:hypothetical protein